CPIPSRLSSISYSYTYSSKSESERLAPTYCFRFLISLSAPVYILIEIASAWRPTMTVNLPTLAMDAWPSLEASIVLYGCCTSLTNVS
ncbi:hypothetical protein TSMEX_011288, partial [Taenia solium]